MIRYANTLLLAILVYIAALSADHFDAIPREAAICFYVSATCAIALTFIDAIGGPDK
jgi:hypothetical protein